jgi:beta-glucosidase
MGGPGSWGRPAPVPTTTFPQAIGMGGTWDPELIRQIGAAEGYETRYIYQSDRYKRGALVVRAPNADMGRDPRWGRTEECFGEDPYFNGTMVVAMTRGLQGDHPRYWQTAALMKHFLANSNENDREKSSSEFDERLFREYYSVPFRMGVMEGGSNAYMAAYNAYNGIPCTVHPILINITMKEWGLDGIICTDGGAMNLLVTQHAYYRTASQAAAWCIRSGINQYLDRYVDAVNEALRKGYLAEAEIDQALRGSFRVLLRLGLMDPPEMVPYSAIKQSGDEPAPWEREENKALARLATQKSIVLLKNSGGLLPLDKEAIKTVAVVGTRADQVLLDWYSGTPPYAVSPLEGIRAKVGADVVVKHASNNDGGAAVAVAGSADVVIVCVGNHPTGAAGWAKVTKDSYGKEAVDRKIITLEDEELIKQVYAVNPRMVVVLISSFPYAMNWTQENVPAIVHMTHNSQETGNALADVLFGDYNPAGRLVQTWPRSLEQLPPMMDYNIRNGRTYMYFQGDPLYPFGFGLSYTTFEYSNLGTSATLLDANGSVMVSVDVKNSGERSGEEVVQLYVKHLDSAVQRPMKELKGFRRVAIRAGQTKTVKIQLEAKELAYWDVTKRKFVVEAGRVQLMVGASSRDIRLQKTIEVKQGANGRARRRR